MENKCKYVQKYTQKHYADGHSDTYLLIRIRKFNLPVNSPWPKESLIQNINPIGSHQNLSKIKIL